MPIDCDEAWKKTLTDAALQVVNTDLIRKMVSNDQVT